MRFRLSLFVAVAAMTFAGFVPVVTAQQINPTGPGDAQLAQYVEPETGGGSRGASPAPPAPAQGEVKGLPFTGLMLLPMAMVGVALLYGGLAWQRRASTSPRPS